LQLELTRRGIPYRVQSGVRFFEQAHLKDVISFLKLIVNPRDELAWKRVLKLIPSIGNATANRIWEQIALAENPVALIKSGTSANSSLQIAEKIRAKTSWQNFIKLLNELTADANRKSPSRQIELILESGYIEHLENTFENAEARLEDLQQLVLYARKYESTEEFLSELSLLSTEGLAGEDVVSGGEDDELLTLTSIHQAKGLEWKAVFIIWAADGKFPSPRALRDTEGEEEERRLWYVALTRAQDELYITYPLLITDYTRQTVLQKPSRFVTEIPVELFEIWSLDELNEGKNDDEPLHFGEEFEPKGFIN
jgi:DNA helicase-2/ATP-dependent DNA helicase PcrA